MIKKLRHTFLVAAVAGAGCLISGCGPTQAQLDEQLGQIRDIADEAMRTANTADYQAALAKDMADEALTKMRRMMMKDSMMMKKRKMMKSMMK